jgi:hypothetical protein
MEVNRKKVSDTKEVHLAGKESLKRLSKTTNVSFLNTKDHLNPESASIYDQNDLLQFLRSSYRMVIQRDLLKPGKMKVRSKKI